MLITVTDAKTKKPIKLNPNEISSMERRTKAEVDDIYKDKPLLDRNLHPNEDYTAIMMKNKTTILATETMDEIQKLIDDVIS